MRMITFEQKGDFKKTDRFLEKVLETIHFGILDRYGKEGVELLRAATPKDTGKTANSWEYEIIRSKGEVKIVWKNTNKKDGYPIAVLIQYGHGTANGYFVEGVDYINPAMAPLFDKIADAAWREVTKL